MPFQAPWLDLPEVPDVPSGEDWRKVLEAYRLRQDAWWRQVQGYWARNFQQAEALPQTGYKGSSSTQALTSVAVLLSSVQVDVLVPQGGYIEVIGFADFRCSTAAIAAIGELYSMAPGETTHTTRAGTTHQIILDPRAVTGEMRGTFGQVWRVANARPGQWSFQLRGRKASTQANSSASAELHSALSVKVI